MIITENDIKEIRNIFFNEIEKLKASGYTPLKSSLWEEIKSFPRKVRLKLFPLYMTKKEKEDAILEYQLEQNQDD